MDKDYKLKVEEEIQSRLTPIDFNSLWPGFHPFDFALYDSHNVVLKGQVLPYSQAFMGNTSIEFQGKLIAIWNLEGEKDSDLDILASELVHEMFHAFQFEKGEERFPDDLRLLSIEYSPLALSLKRKENLALKKAVQTGNEEFFAEFFYLRKERMNAFPEEKEELFAETIEGCAEFNGLQALKMISESKYRKRVSDYLAKITDDSSLFDPRRLTYFTGSVFMLACSLFHKTISFSLEESKPYFMSLDMPSRQRKIVISPAEQEFCSDLSKKDVQSRKEKITAFKATTPTEIPFDGRIVGYDPMNMVRSDNYFLCTDFIMLRKKGDKGNGQFIKGPLLLKMEDKSPYWIISYYK